MRRSLPSLLALAAGLLVAGCNSLAVTFEHGVASGDPLTDKVILWTHVTPSGTAPVTLTWQVASDAAFTTIVKSGEVTASTDTDFTAKVDATGLSPGTSYFYRFQHGDQVSKVGKTKTLPSGTVTHVKLAVFSCTNYPSGYFNVYADAAKEPDLDVALHLGDTIYEYGRAGFGTNDAGTGRVVDPAGETVKLADYRTRYAQYRLDPDLQALTASVPLIVVWDDHEVANNSWTGGAENHNPATQGSYAARRAAAFQAFHEWTPTRLADPAHPEKIYRSFDFGNLVSLHMLDTRHIGRDQQLDILSYVTSSGGFDAAKFVSEVGSPTRQLLGAEQTTWLQGQLTASTATWQILGQQIVMGRMNIPAPIALQSISISAYTALVIKAQTAPQDLTFAEKYILGLPSIPYNLDAWDGYQAAREVVLGTARALNKNLVVLSGDTHNAWGNNLDDKDGNKVAVEFAGPSVTSPGLEEIFTSENPAVVAGGITQIIPTLKYADTGRRGWMVITATPDQVTGDWRYVSTITSRTHTSSSGKILAVKPGPSGRRLVDP